MERKVYGNDAFGSLENITSKKIYNILIDEKSKTPVKKTALMTKIDWSAVWKQKIVSI